MEFRAHFLNVGCADCTIFEMGEDLVMIDCGYRRVGKDISRPTNIYQYLKNTIGKTYIDLLMITHPHHDHYLGIQDLLGKVTVAKFWGSPYERRHGDNSLSLDEWNEYCDLKEKLVSDANRRFICYKDNKISFSDYIFQILGPRKDVNSNESRECHDASLVVWAHSPANNFLICGDASDAELENVKSEWDISNCQVVRASHHGSINGANLDFIKSLSPRDTIISTESGIIESVPHDTALQRYRTHSKNLFRTDTDGTCITPLKVS